MKEIYDFLMEFSEDEYADFEAKLNPVIDRNNCLGVRVPNCRKIAKIIKNTSLEEKFLDELPHKYFDENMLHSVIINGINTFDRAIYETTKFLPYVDNWAVCDTLHSKGLGKNREELLKHINDWLKSNNTYTIRFAVDCLMTYFLDDYFDDQYLTIVSSIVSNEYYVNMMIAWYFATALAKKYDATIKVIENKVLSPWVQNKAIQKAKESFRISKETKEYLETLKIK